MFYVSAFDVTFFDLVWREMFAFGSKSFHWFTSIRFLWSLIASSFFSWNQSLDIAHNFAYRIVILRVQNSIQISREIRIRIRINVNSPVFTAISLKPIFSYMNESWFADRMNIENKVVVVFIALYFIRRHQLNAGRTHSKGVGNESAPLFCS